jgi:hypothetical protein
MALPGTAPYIQQLIKGWYLLQQSGEIFIPSVSKPVVFQTLTVNDNPGQAGG